MPSSPFSPLDENPAAVEKGGEGINIYKRPERTCYYGMYFLLLSRINKKEIVDGGKREIEEGGNLFCAYYISRIC